MRCCLAFVLAGLFVAPACGQDSLAESLAAIRKVDQLGAGTAEAQAASKQLQAATADALPEIAAAFQGANPLAANWLRSVFEVNFDKAIRTKQPIPTDRLLAFVKNTNGDPRARRMVFEWLAKLDGGLADKLIPTMLLDPSSEFRRDAVTRLIESAAQQKKDGHKKMAIELFSKALSGAIHEDQVKAIVKPLEDLGEEVDVQQHFGFLPDWYVIGPFDNRDKKGFPVAYPPEKELNLKASYDSEYAKSKVVWNKYSTDNAYGILDIAKEIENHKGSCMYATTDYVSDATRQVEIRLGTPNAWKLWLNGKLVFEREEYHRSTQMDQYKLKVTMNRGANTILLKVCQNEQDEDWAQDYHYQLRVCNSTGSAILPATTRTTQRSGQTGGTQ